MEEMLNNIESPDLSCSVCLNEKIENENLCNTNCNHNFCKECIGDWLNQGKNTCPICRTVLKSYMNHDQETKLITIQNRRPPSIDNVIINGRSGREVIADLISNNLKLRYMLFMFGFGGVILLLFYLILKDDFDELFINYHRCMNNYTELVDLLKRHMGSTRIQSRYRGNRGRKLSKQKRYSYSCTISSRR